MRPDEEECEARGWFCQDGYGPHHRWGSFCPCPPDAPEAMHDLNRLAHFKATGVDDLYEGCPRKPMTKIAAAVAVITQEQDGKMRILGVSRKDDHAAWGLPGGSIEEGETPEDAMVREVREETGLIVSESRKIFVRIDDHGVAAAAFEVLECFGEPRTVEQGLVRWLEPKELLAEKAPFREYNARLFRRLGWTAYVQ